MYPILPSAKTTLSHTYPFIVVFPFSIHSIPFLALRRCASNSASRPSNARSSASSRTSGSWWLQSRNSPTSTKYRLYSTRKSQAERDRGRYKREVQTLNKIRKEIENSLNQSGSLSGVTNYKSSHLLQQAFQERNAMRVCMGNGCFWDRADFIRSQREEREGNHRSAHPNDEDFDDIRTDRAFLFSTWFSDSERAAADAERAAGAGGRFVRTVEFQKSGWFSRKSKKPFQCPFDGCKK